MLYELVNFLMFCSVMKVVNHYMTAFLHFHMSLWRGEGGFLPPEVWKREVEGEMGTGEERWDALSLSISPLWGGRCGGQ